jgi:hypothetical protein
MPYILEVKCKTNECPGVLYYREMTESEMRTGLLEENHTSPFNLKTCELCGKTNNYRLRDTLLPRLFGPRTQ